jgi:hypothetical protein
MPTQFITPSELRRYPLPVTDKQWDKIDYDQLVAVTAYASQHVQDYLDRNIFKQQYAQRIRGNNRASLLLEHYPVTSLVSVTHTSTDGVTVTDNNADFLVNGGAGIIEWIDKETNGFYKNFIWTVTYVAGYDECPGPIKHATALQSLSMLQPLFRGGTDFTEVELVDAIDESIVDMLEKYKRKRIG